MRKSCADIDLRDYKVLMPWVWDCILRHYDRYDFRDILLDYDIPLSDYVKVLQEHDTSLLYRAVKPIAQKAARCITERSLKLRPPRIRTRLDPSTGKIRPIGCEEPMQQIFDTIAVCASTEIWNRRIVPQQVSSIPERGPLHGIRIIQSWILADNRAMRYAKAHGLSYTSKCKYHDKSDIRQCFPSARSEVFMAFFRRDCANQDLVWLWETLLVSHRVEGYEGFLIGSLLSQWAMQYMLSFAYRYAMDLMTERRGKRIKMVQHMLLQMDDILFIGSNRKNLKSAIRKVAKYIKSQFGLEIKPNWHIKNLDEEPIDIMGYVVHRNGKLTIRSRNFLRGRRLVMRYYREHALTLQQARRLASYKGFFKHTHINYVKVWKNDSKKLDIAEAVDYAASVISKYEKGVNNGTIRRKGTIQRPAGSCQIYAASEREGGCLDQVRYPARTRQRKQSGVVSQGSLFTDSPEPGGN